MDYLQGYHLGRPQPLDDYLRRGAGRGVVEVDRELDPGSALGHGHPRCGIDGYAKPDAAVRIGAGVKDAVVGLPRALGLNR